MFVSKIKENVASINALCITLNKTGKKDIERKMWKSNEKKMYSNGYM